MDKNNRKGEFVEFLTPNYYKIHSFILSLVPNKADAEDVLQAAITYMWEHFEDFRQGTNFLAWAFTISKYQVMTHRRKTQRSIIQFSEEAIQLIEDENRRLAQESDQRLEILDGCMQALRTRDRMLISKRFEKKTSTKELAAELNMSVHVAYKRLARIKSLLLDCIRNGMAAGEVL